MKKMLMLVIFVLMSGLIASAKEVILAEQGVPRAAIILPHDAKPIVQFAAGELKLHLDRMTGADFSIAEDTDLPVQIRLGMEKADGFQQDQFAIRVRKNIIDIYGLDDDYGRKQIWLYMLLNQVRNKGTLFGTYAFLDRLGVRWPAPGEKNTYIPKCSKLLYGDGDILFVPSFKLRFLLYDWYFKTKLPDGKEYIAEDNDLFKWRLRNCQSTDLICSGAHSELSLGLYRHAPRMKHPECWQLNKKGKRNPRYSCWTSDLTRQYFIQAAQAFFAGKSPKDAGFNLKASALSAWPSAFRTPDEFMIDPMDNSFNEDGRCYCSRCEDFRKKYPCPDDSEIMWKVIAGIAEKLKDQYPGKYITTLVYPPKRCFPKYTRLPENVRVRICLAGPRNMPFPKQLKLDLNTIRQWGNFQGRDKVVLWCYHCASFARTLPGIPDVYPRLIDQYLRKIHPLCAGFFMETHSTTHTLKNLDEYIFLRMAFDLSRNVEKELSDYFNMYYGPAAGEMQEFYQLLQEKWIAVDRLVRPDNDVPSLAVTLPNREQIQKLAWQKIYTSSVMVQLEKLLRKAEAAAGKNEIFSFRVKQAGRWILDVMEAERKLSVEMEEKRADISLEVHKTEAKGFPAAEEWNSVQEYPLIQAQPKGAVKLMAPSSFKVLFSNTHLFFRISLQEPELDHAVSHAGMKSGMENLWKDNVVELFFYAMASEKYHQIIVNHQGLFTVLGGKKTALKSQKMPGLFVRTSRTEEGWKADITVPLAALDIRQGELRFNLGRERRVENQKEEFSTWSPLAVLGYWGNHHRYGTVRFGGF